MSNPPFSFAVNRFLFIRLSSLGDVVKCLPAYLNLKKLYPEAQARFLVDARFGQALADTLPEKEIWTVPKSSSFSLGAYRKLKSALRAQQFDLAVDAHGNLRSGLLCKMSGAKYRLGFARGFHKEGWLNAWQMTHTIAPHGLAWNRTQMGLALVEALGGSSELTYPFMTAHPEALAKGKEIFQGSGPHVLMHTGGSAKGAYKRWYPERYAQLAQFLYEIYKAQIYWVWGSAEEHQLAQHLMSQTQVPTKLTPHLDFAGLKGVLAAADLVIGADSGPVHMADALGTPVVSIHGPKDPLRYAPVGPLAQAVSYHLDCGFPQGTEGPACRNTACAHRSCLDLITVQDVLGATARILG